MKHPNNPPRDRKGEDRMQFMRNDGLSAYWHHECSASPSPFHLVCFLTQNQDLSFTRAPSSLQPSVPSFAPTQLSYGTHGMVRMEARCHHIGGRPRLWCYLPSCDSRSTAQSKVRNRVQPTGHSNRRAKRQTCTHLQPPKSN
jgi:hypothetical protein